MYRTVLSIAFICSLSLTMLVCSDSNQGRQRRSPREQALQLKEVLDLSDEQTSQVEKIYSDSREEMEKLREAAGGDRRQMRQLMMESREKIEAQISALLSDEQKEKYQSCLEERLERMRERGFERGNRE